MRLSKSGDGGVVIVWEDNGDEKRLKFDVDNDGNVIEKGVGPNGSKEGKRDPSGGGQDTLGV